MIGSKLQPKGVEPMNGQPPFDPEARLNEVAEAFEQWRATRKRRDRIPESLWEAAGELAPFYSTFKISKTLRLDFKELKRRINLCATQSPPLEFVELKVEQMFSSTPCRLRLCSPAGFELEIQIEGDLPTPVYQLMSCFLKESR
jgi:hypothetical protein